MPSPARPETLAGLMARLAADLGGDDRGGNVAMALHRVRDRLDIEPLSAMGLRDGVLTLSLDAVVRVIVTGRLAAVPGEWTVHWSDRDLAAVRACLAAEPVAEPWVICSLDASWRGRRGRLRWATGRWAAGTPVRARALATVGERVEVRIVVGGEGLSLGPDAVAWEEDDAAAAAAAAEPAAAAAAGES